MDRCSRETVQVEGLHSIILDSSDDLRFRPSPEETSSMSTCQPYSEADEICRDPDGKDATQLRLPELRL